MSFGHGGYGKGQGRKYSFLKKRTKDFCLTLSLPSQVAQTPEKSKVFCFFSLEKKTLLPTGECARWGLARPAKGARAV
jgi:hypothetical protein